ncbi:Sel1-repeat containing protein [Gracilaria domingensis]|nr:Sel1-repeat containing protein [Gracilaria domingensis]
MGYIIVYSVVQGKAGEYSEMSASGVAAFLAAVIGVRTIWGLWQLHEFRHWAQKSIDALNAVGIEYCLAEERRLKRKKKWEKWSSAEISDEILVNEKIIDNVITHGDARSYLMFGDLTLLKGGDEDLTLIAPLKTCWRWITFFGAVALEWMRQAIGKGGGKNVKQVALESVELWIRWSCVFVSQGMQKWMKEFDVTIEPEATEEETLSARDRYDLRGRYFGAEVVGSAAMHLWTEGGQRKGMSPMLWYVWEDESDMSDGRVVKQELLTDAAKSGECLPYGGSQWDESRWRLGARKEGRIGYKDYKGVMKEFIGELPVRYTFAEEMEKFDVNMLEWLTIILHIGRRCEGTKEETENITRDSKEVTQNCEVCGRVEVGNRESKEGVRSLYAQIGMDTKRGFEGRLVCSIPMLRNVISLRSESNRLVTKVGELIDVWLSLVIGEQIEFLVESLNGEWERICLGRREDVIMLEDLYDSNGDGGSEEGEGLRIRKVHRELTKRRLGRRVADRNERYGYMDTFVTFMGYRMESVRSEIGRWVREQAGKTGDALFEGVKSCNKGDREFEFIFEPSEELELCLEARSRISMLTQRRVQTRMIWEVQTWFETKLKKEDSWGVDERGHAVAILLILSFPGLNVRLRAYDGVAAVEDRKNETRIGFGAEERIKSIEMDVTVMCGVQKVGVRITIGGKRKWRSRLLWEEEEISFKWKWWRESFAGRLEGTLEWQDEMGIDGAEIVDSNFSHDNSESRTENNIVSFKTITGRSFETWKEWSVFRTGICRFELESKGFLQELKVEGKKEAGYSTAKEMVNVANLPLWKVKSVCYNHAREAVLQHSCAIIEERLEHKAFDEKSAGKLNHSEDVGRNLVTLSERFEEAEALTLLEIAATEYGMGEAMKKYVKVLMGERTTVRRVLEAVGLLQTYLGVSMTLKNGELRIAEGKEKEVEDLVAGMCEEIIDASSGTKEEAHEIGCVLLTCLTLDLGVEDKRVTGMLQRLIEVCGSTSYVGLILFERFMLVMEDRQSRWKNEEYEWANNGLHEVPGTMLSTENHRTRKEILEMITCEWKKERESVSEEVGMALRRCREQQSYGHG